eukprot:scaffold9171_cov17-Tisochrysis_lutea.AAC.1
MISWHITTFQNSAHASNRTRGYISFLFLHNFPWRSNLTSSCPDGKVITPYQVKPTSSSPLPPLSPCAQHLIEDQRSCPRSYPSLSANQQRMHFIESKYCEDRRPEQLVEAAQRQHAEICQNVSGKAVALHTILLGVGGTSFL